MAVEEHEDRDGNPAFRATMTTGGRLLRLEMNFPSLEIARKMDLEQGKYFVEISKGQSDSGPRSIALTDDDMLELFQGWLVLRERYRSLDEEGK